MRLRDVLRRSALVAVAFAGGACAAGFASATSRGESPYALFGQLARVLVLVENEYVDPVDRSRLLDGAVRGMVAELDPHSSYMTPDEYRAFRSDTEGHFGGIGVEVDLRDGVITVVAPIEGAPAARAGILPGDRVVSVEGVGMMGEALDKLVVKLRGAPGTHVHLGVRRAGVERTLRFELVREEVRVASVAAKRLDGDVAYVRIKQFQRGTHDELLAQLAEVRAAARAPLAGVVLDLRTNPGGLVDEAAAVADEVLEGGTIYSTRRRGQVVDEVVAHRGGALAGLPAVVLVDAYSASAAELVAGALQDARRATVVGGATFGKGSVQTIVELPGGAGMRLTTMRYYTPAGRSLQAEGVKPDVPVASAAAGEPDPVVRERDLDHHLQSEAASEVDSPRAPAPARVAPVREIPANPVGGNDAVLERGYTLVRAAAAPR